MNKKTLKKANELSEELDLVMLNLQLAIKFGKPPITSGCESYLTPEESAFSIVVPGTLRKAIAQLIIEENNATIKKLEEELEKL